MQIHVHVHPGSKHPGVGGEHDGRLVVRVAARAVDGKATSAVAEALATAFDLRNSDVTLVRGGHSRDKVFELAGDDKHLTQRLTALLLKSQ